MDANDLGRAASLVSQSQDFARVLDALNEGGSIVEMKVGPEAIPVSTEDIQYPPQMADALKQMIQTRKDAIDQELIAMGVTGTGGGGEQPWTPPAAAPAAARTTPQPAGRGRTR